MQTKIYYEFERPEGWNGEVVDMNTYAGEVDYFELEVEGLVCIEIDDNYGADADGNRGARVDFSYVEDITVILDGDFRTLGRKVRDFFLVRYMNAHRVEFEEFYTWKSFKDNAPFRFKGLSDGVLTGSEQASIEAMLFESVEDYEPDYDPREDYPREDY